MMRSTEQKYAIIGFPLEHSQSPSIHNAAFKAYDLKATYQAVKIDPNQLSETINWLKKENWNGFNVTIPYKQRILPYLDRIDPLAKKIGAVNTIRIDEKGKWAGFNTDYIGFVRPLQDMVASINSCLIIGAGGAARAVAFGILDRFDPTSLTILNRTISNAKNLINDLRKYKAVDYRFGSLGDALEREYDLIVNTTSVGMSGFPEGMPVELGGKVGKHSIVYDLIYKPPQTALIRKAISLGLRAINGWPMLIYQAEAAFEIWTGKRYSPELLKMFLKNPH